MCRLFGESQVAICEQPLVNADAAIHPLGAVIGDHQHGRRVIGKREQLADFTVHFSVVVTNRILKFVAGLVEAMSRVHIVPKRMVDTVHAHLNYHEIIPIFLR